MEKEKLTKDNSQQNTFLDDQDIRRVFRETAEEIPAVDDDAVFTQIEQRIGKVADMRQQKNNVADTNVWKVKDYLYSLFNGPRFAWGIVAAQAVVLCFFLASSPRQASYITLSSDQPVNQSVAPVLYVIFDDSATIKDIEQLLFTTGGNIISGPDNKSVYTIQFHNSNPENIQETFQVLQQSSLVTFMGNIY